MTRPAAVSAPLTPKQKRYLARLARRAWQAAEREVGSETDFRHAEVARACGKLGLRCCTQDDFQRVRAHFLWLLGEDAAAFRAHLRAETEPRRQAEAVLRRECARAGLSLGYPAAICVRQYRCALADASPRQLWTLIYTVRNRARARAYHATARPGGVSRRAAAAPAASGRSPSQQPSPAP